MVWALEHAAQHEPYHFAVLFLDLDDFKTVNDSFGHLVGDQLLIVIARRIEHCLRGCDTVAWLSGDEFAILLDKLRHVQDAIVVAEKIDQELRRPFSIRGHTVHATVSIGIAMNTGGSTTPEELLHHADMALYEAKAQGKATYDVFRSDGCTAL